MYFSYDHLTLRYEPFPIGLAKPLMEEGLYQEFVDNYPPIDLFDYIPKLGKKYSLSERYHPDQYKKFIQSHSPWKEFHRWIKSDEFVNGVLEALHQRHIDLGYDLSVPAAKRFVKLVRDFSRGRTTSRLARLRARFEFSMLPADGGNIMPHTDAPSKIITLVVSMLNQGEWDPAFGGGTEIDQAQTRELQFNQLNTQASFDDMEVLDTFEFTPNQAVVFVKTFNSWHSVRPMLGAGSSAMRKTLTINIETSV